MRRGSFLAIALAVGVVGAGCQPLYGGKPEKVSSPRARKRPKDKEITEIEIKPVESCQASFHDDPKLSKSNANQAMAAATNAEQAMGQAARATDATAQGNYWKIAIDGYRNALVKDPWNPALTLKLAVAYDTVLRKGCALALLRRIGQMVANQRYQQKASAAADDVVSNTQWFAKYRTDATQAVGR